MIKPLAIVSVAILALGACGSNSEPSASPSASGTQMTSVPSVVPTPEPTPAATSAEPAPGFDPSAPVVLGAATVTGELGQEPTVQVDTSADPAVELGVSDILAGTGAAVQTGDVVTAHYVGYGASSGQMFDGSWLRGEPATFPLDRVIAGWQLGLVGMQEGGRRLLVIPADMGYGQSPPEGSGIAPGETLIFVVDLVSVG